MKTKQQYAPWEGGYVTKQSLEWAPLERGGTCLICLLASTCMCVCNKQELFSLNSTQRKQCKIKEGQEEVLVATGPSVALEGSRHQFTVLLSVFLFFHPL